MELKGKFKIVEKLVKTQAKNWKALKEGDIIEIKLELKNEKGSGQYQVYPKIYIEGTDINWYDSLLNVISRIYGNFKVEQIN